MLKSFVAKFQGSIQQNKALVNDNVADFVKSIAQNMDIVIIRQGKHNDSKHAEVVKEMEEIPNLTMATDLGSVVFRNGKLVQELGSKRLEEVVRLKTIYNEVMEGN